MDATRGDRRQVRTGTGLVGTVARTPSGVVSVNILDESLAEQ
jgi:hypothetical protein